MAYWDREPSESSDRDDSDRVPTLWPIAFQCLLAACRRNLCASCVCVCVRARARTCVRV